MPLLDFENESAKYSAILRTPKDKAPYIEIRTRAKAGFGQVVLVVSLEEFPNPYHTKPIKANVKFSQNGTSYFTWEEVEDLNKAVLEAKVILEGIVNDRTNI